MKNKKVKTILFIDGTNLYAAQYELFGPVVFLRDIVHRQVEKKKK